MELETVWSGNTWRTYPPPTLAPPTAHAAVARRMGTARDTYSGRTLVYAVLDSGGWHSVKGVIARTGLSDRQVRMHLMFGARDGRLDRMNGAPVRPGLRPVFLYRRRQIQEQAA